MFIWFNLLIQFLYLVPTFSTDKENDIFYQDISNQMTIGISENGYKSVQLKCDSKFMTATLELEDEFDGVIYTRGSFSKKNSPCFYDPKHKKNPKIFTIKFPIDDCNTKKNGNTYSNTLILQHDKELIMPGDAAFYLECDFTKTRDITVNANFELDTDVKSRITLTDADPSGKDINSDKLKKVVNSSYVVTLKSNFFNKDEL